MVAFGGADEMGDFGYFAVSGGVDTSEGIGGFVADGGETEGADLEDLVEDSGLFKTDVFDVSKRDDVEGIVDESG